MSESAAPFFTSGGVTGRLIAAIDWCATPLGGIASWPLSLKTIVAMMLQSRQPMFLWWGPELIQFYNDAYVPSFTAAEHPRAMGQRGAECWGERWSIMWPQIDDAMSRGRASWNEDQLAPIFRDGRIEEAYFSYGYSPVRDDRGIVGGTLLICTETTSRVVAERRVTTIVGLSDALSGCKDLRSIAERAVEVAAAAKKDIPFALVYQTDPVTQKLAVAASTLADDARQSELAGAILRALEKHDADGDSAAASTPLPDGVAVACGSWPEPPTEFFGVRRNTMVFRTVVLGVSSRLPFDAAYADFFDRFVAQIELASARVEAFRATALAEERKNLLLQAPLATALISGPRHVYEFANLAYIQMVGGRNIVGKAYIEAFPEVVGTALPEVLDRVYQTGEPYVAEEYLVPLDWRADGNLQDRFFRFTLEPVRDGSGAVYGMMAVAVDITEQASARRALERTGAEQRKLVRELESANRTKDEFLAAVSHELRTPLNAILGWARLLRDGNVHADKVERALGAIERNSLSQVRLIDDLLDVSRIINGKLRLDVQPMSLSPVVEAAIESMQHALEVKNIRFEHVVDPSAGPISGDAHRIQQVIWNLLSNAVKFTPKGGTVRLVVERVDSNIELSVTDTGQGLPRHLLSTVFDRFQQAESSASRVHGGLGLGLAIARNIVELHGGTIRVHSEGEGRGATFVVSLPISPFRSDVRGPFRNPVPCTVKLQFERPEELQGLTVLVVDDEADTRELLVEVLQRLGALALTAKSAKEGLAVLDRCSPRVLVSDIGMPDMDGYDFIRAVRERPTDKGGGVVALALTAYAGSEERLRALRAGFQMHLAKPVEPAEFAAALANLAQLAIAKS